MKTKILSFSIFCLLTIIISGCSKHEFDPEDYTMSLLSGEYHKDSSYNNLKVYVNNKPIDNFDKVAFHAKADLKEATINFINVIPEESIKEFKDVPLEITDNGVEFKIEYTSNKIPIVIKGILTWGTMTINIVM